MMRLAVGQWDAQSGGFPRVWHDLRLAPSPLRYGSDVASGTQVAVGSVSSAAFVVCGNGSLEKHWWLGLASCEAVRTACGAVCTAFGAVRMYESIL
jgi:hypothetical protein